MVATNERPTTTAERRVQRRRRDRHVGRQEGPRPDAEGRRHHGRRHAGAGEDRRGGGRLRRHGARARAFRHPRARRRRPHVRPGHDQRDHRGRDDPRDGEGAHRPLRRGAGAGGARRRLHRRVRSADAGRRGAPHQQAPVQGAVRLRLPRPRRGAAAHRRGRGDDPHEGRGRHRQRRRGGAPHAPALGRHPPHPEHARRRADRRRRRSSARPSSW